MARTMTAAVAAMVLMAACEGGPMGPTPTDRVELNSQPQRVELLRPVLDGVSDSPWLHVLGRDELRVDANLCTSRAREGTVTGSNRTVVVWQDGTDLGAC